MSQQGADILTAGVHLLFRPQPLTAPLNQQGGNAPLHRPAVKSVLRSGTYPVGYSQDLGGGQGDLVDYFLPRCGEEHQWMKRLVAVSAVEISQQIGFRVQSRFQSKGQSSGKAARRIAGEGSVQIDAVLWHHLFGSGIEGAGICQRQEDDVPRQSRRVQFSSQAAQCLGPHIFAPMDPACDNQCSAPCGAAQADCIQRRSIRYRERYVFPLTRQKCCPTKNHTATSEVSVSNTTMDSSSRRAYSSLVSLMRLTGRYSVTRP